MKKIFYIYLLFILLILKNNISASMTQAEGMVEIPILIISPDAHGSSMAEGLSAESKGIEALYWNPAGLSSLNNNELMLSYKRTLDIMDYLYLAFGPTLSKNNPLRFGFGLAYMQGPNLGNFGSIYYLNTIMGVSFEIIHVKLGTTLKYIYRNIFQNQDQGISFDFGLQYSITTRIKTGLSIKNLGFFFNQEYISSDFPLLYHWDTSFIIFNYDISMIKLITGVEKIIDFDPSFCLATEYQYNHFLALRGGYKIQTGNNQEGNTYENNISFGMGLIWDLAQFNLSFLPFKNFEAMNISFQLFF